eukprot:6186593-Pleurochrysis_carterae.AAC.4
MVPCWRANSLKEARCNLREVSLIDIRLQPQAGSRTMYRYESGRQFPAGAVASSLLSSCALNDPRTATLLPIGYWLSCMPLPEEMKA